MDDTAGFDIEKLRNARAMASDGETQRLVKEALVAVDKFNYSYQMTWMGLPIIQCPSDIVAQQEIIWATKPSVIIETGVARGGSMVFLASMLKLTGGREVIGVDIDIREHNRARIEGHFTSDLISLIQGSSIDTSVVQKVRSRLRPDDKVMVILDSNHTHDHVLQELNMYAPLVTPGQYMIVADTVVEFMPTQDHRPRSWKPGDNPYTAMKEFQSQNPKFITDMDINNRLVISSNLYGYLKRIE